MAVKRLWLIFANLLYGETLAPRQTLIHIGTKHELCVLKFRRENVLQAVGGVHECWKYLTKCCSTSWEGSLWHLDIHPGQGLQYSGAHGASEDRRSMGGWVGGNEVGCFLCNHPRSDWSQLQTAHFLNPLKVCKVRLVTKLPPPLTGARFSCFLIINPSYLGFLNFD